MPLEIEFSKHSLLKIDILKSHGIGITKEKIEEIIKTPDKIELGYKERLIAQKVIDEIHVLRVVYESSSEKIYVVTVYPGRRLRYEKD